MSTMSSLKYIHFEAKWRVDHQVSYWWKSPLSKIQRRHSFSSEHLETVSRNGDFHDSIPCFMSKTGKKILLTRNSESVSAGSVWRVPEFTPVDIASFPFLASKGRITTIHITNTKTTMELNNSQISTQHTSKYRNQKIFHFHDKLAISKVVRYIR